MALLRQESKGGPVKVPLPKPRRRVRVREHASQPCIRLACKCGRIPIVPATSCSMCDAIP